MLKMDYLGHEPFKSITKIHNGRKCYDFGKVLCMTIGCRKEAYVWELEHDAGSKKTVIPLCDDCNRAVHAHYKAK